MGMEQRRVPPVWLPSLVYHRRAREKRGKAAVYQVKISGLDLEKTAESGQCFRLTPRGAGWHLAALGRSLDIQPMDGGEFLFSCSEAEYRAVWTDYFDIDADYDMYAEAVPPEDAFLTAAAAFSRGVRILRQDPWETLITFILSQRKNIPAIRRGVEELSRRYGAPIPHTGEFAFPGPGSLASAGEEELRACGLGYRAPYVLAAARMTAEGTLNLDSLKALPDAALLEALTAVPGVGVKVANCVRLFGFHRLGAFPRDVWIERVIQEQYGGSFPLERYAGFAGVIQQYLFFYGRSLALAERRGKGGRK